MGLSEREQKLLEEMERGLYAGDARFTRAVNNSATSDPKRLVLGAILAVIGLSLLVFAVIIQIVVFGLLAFAVMLAGVIMASSKTSLNDREPKSSARPKGNPFEDRWDRRIDGQ